MISQTQHGRRLAATVIAVSLAALVATGAVAQSVRQEDPIPESAKQSLIAIENTFTVTKTPPELTLFPQMREQMKEELGLGDERTA